MKAKLLIITALLFLQGYCLFSQCVSVELSITYKQGYDVFKKDSVVSVPFLNITYRNNCDTNYYFLKFCGNDCGGMVLCRWLVHWDTFDLLERAKIHGNYKNENFSVKIGGKPWYNSGWRIEKDGIDTFSLLSNHISCCLENIYEYIYWGSGCKKPKHGYFSSSIVTSENILSGTVQDQFVFLKPNETYVDTYNLIGYKIVEGCFTFFIDRKEIKSFVLGYEGSNSDIEIELPPVVGEYQLYSGPFNTNKVTVCFGDK